MVQPAPLHLEPDAGHAPKIYKFVPPGFEKKIFGEPNKVSLKANLLRDQNDPNEGLMRHGGEKDLIEQLAMLIDSSGSAPSRRRKRKSIHEARRRAKKQFESMPYRITSTRSLYELMGTRTISYSGNLASHLMWSHYAGGCTGFAIEFDYGALRDYRYTSLFEGQHSGAVGIFRMRYSTVPPRLAPSLEPQVNYIEAMTHKGTEWMYEDEYRTFIPDWLCRCVSSDVYVEMLDARCVSGVCFTATRRLTPEPTLRRPCPNGNTA